MRYSEKQILNAVIDYMKGKNTSAIARKHNFTSGKHVGTLISDLRKRGHLIPRRS